MPNEEAEVRTPPADESPAPLTYEEMYPPVDVAALRDYHRTHRDVVDEIRDSYFGIDRTINPRPDVRRAVSVSLFRAHLDNTVANERKMDKRDNKRWRRKYYDPLLENLEWFPRGFDTDQWKLVVYLCPKTLRWFPRPRALKTLRTYDFVEIHVMRHPTIGHGPGASWRLLSIGDYALERMLVFDIDEPWSDSVNTWHEDAATYDKPYTRAHHMPRDGFWLSPTTPWYVERDGRAINYPPVLTSKQLVRPEAFGLADIDVLLAAYVALRQERGRTTNPASQLRDDEPITSYNHPTGRHAMGWGNHWYQYCFDERFLKHVVFPYAVKNGHLCTYCLPQDVTTDLRDYLAQPALRDFLADFRYTQTHPDNVIVNAHRRFDETL